MDVLWLISYLLLWAVVLFLAFLLWGALQQVNRLRWQLEQVVMTTPRRSGRDGLRIGAKAPDFKLPGAAGAEVSLQDYGGRRVLLVFTQTGCKPCHAIVPELNRLQERGDLQVMTVVHGTEEKVRDWATEVEARFPVAIQTQWDVSRRYQAFATPFGFLINEKGVIVSKGIASTKQYLEFLLHEARQVEKPQLEPAAAGEGAA